MLVKYITPSNPNDHPTNLINVNGTLFFTETSGRNGVELWRSNGTAAGTVLLKHVNIPAGGNAPYLANVNGTLFFTGGDSSHGYELWRSNGTGAGTTLVADIFPGDYPPGDYPTTTPHSSRPGELTNVNGTLFFSANDGVHGRELWQSNGTAAGTSLVADIGPASAGSYPTQLANIAGTLFFSANDHTHGFETVGALAMTLGAPKTLR